MMSDHPRKSRETVMNGPLKMNAKRSLLLFNECIHTCLHFSNRCNRKTVMLPAAASIFLLLFFF